eukprot:11886243-Alexandrium_andersonii.AAC.1
MASRCSCAPTASHPRREAAMVLQAAIRPCRRLLLGRRRRPSRPPAARRSTRRPRRSSAASASRPSGLRRP